MTSSTGDGDDKVVAFPKTDEERRSLRKAKQDREKQRLINTFIEEAGGDQALFHTNDGIGFADLIIAGHRETWPSDRGNSVTRTCGTCGNSSIA